MPTDSPPVTRPALGGPLARFRMSERTFMVVAGTIVGVLVGYGAIGFRWLMDALQRVAWHDAPLTLELVRSKPFWWVILVPAVGGLLVGPLVFFVAREAKGHGVPEVMEAVALRSGLIRMRVAIVKIIASAITIASGGSVGREGPMAQIGAGLGSMVGQVLAVNGRRLRTLVGCGVAAGIAATFNAPIAGAIFAVEIVLGDFAVTQFSPIVIASVVGTVVARSVIGDEPAFMVPHYTLVHPVEMVLYLLLGVLAAFVARLFIAVLYGAEDVVDRLPLPPLMLTPIGMGLVGAVGLWRPEVLGVGYQTIEAALHGQLLGPMLLLLLLVKILMTSLTISVGGSGGIFAPSLFLGAMTGGAFGVVVHHLFPGVTAPPGAYALVGMGAVVAAATHAPLTAILILFEMTYDYQIIAPLMAACIIATLVATRLAPDNIYTRKLLRHGIDLAAGREVNILRALRVRDVMDSEAITIAPAAHLGEIVDRLATSGKDYFYVVDGEMRLRGVVALPELRAALAEMENLRDLVVAADLARTDVPVVTPDDDLDTVMRIFGGKNREELPVVEDRQGRRFLGTVSRAHLLEAYRRELMKRDMVSEMAGGLAATDRDAVALGEGHWMKQIPVPGTFAGKTLGELDVRGRYGVQIVLVRRPRGRTHRRPIESVPGPDTRLELGDVLVAVGDREAIERLERM